MTAPAPQERARTPFQTVGPYFSIRLGGEGQNVLVDEATLGDQILVAGVMYDGAGNVVDDALVEIWQADARGRYRHPRDAWGVSPDREAFTGFGRAQTQDGTGEYWFQSVRPGRVPDPQGGLQAPHINLIVQARGLLKAGFTRMYFSDESAANQGDLVLSMVPDDRRHTLIARLESDQALRTYRHDIHLQGVDETVFMDF